MAISFQNKVVLVTGASSGIGKAITIEFLRLGAKVAICARNETQLKSFAAELNTNRVFAKATDVSQENQCKEFVETTHAHFGQIDILVNNAGISMRALFQDLDLQVLKQSMDINFWGTVYMSKYALPFIIKNRGTIAGISSIAGYKGLPCRTGYSASKFAMQGFLESLRIEMLPLQVNVMWISPGFVASNIRNKALNADGETPLDEKKLMSPETCAKLIIEAIAQRKRTLVMTFQGKLTVWMNKFFPSFVDKQVFKHFANEPDSPLAQYK
jgi:short-subunit dehydrogenase